MMNRLSRKTLVKSLVMLVTVAVIGVLLKTLGLGDLLKAGWIDSEVRGKGLAGLALFLGISALFTAVGLPRQVPSFLAGYAFGAFAGSGWATLATLGGAVLSFYVARFVGRDFLVRRFPHWIKRIDEALEGHDFSMTLAIRLSPFSNNLATNLAGGMAGVRPAPFFLASALGFWPQSFIFALLGSGFALDPALRIGVGVALFIGSTVLGLVLWRRVRARQGLPEELPDARS